jgi:hypothetical protein
MIIHVTEVKYLDHYRLWLAFDNGVSGEIDLESILWGDVFAPLKDTALFAKVTVNLEIGTIVWPNGADLAPEFLLKGITGELNQSS